MTKVLLKAISTMRYPASSLDRNMCHADGSTYRFWHQAMIKGTFGFLDGSLPINSSGYPDYRNNSPGKRKISIASEGGQAKLTL